MSARASFPVSLQNAIETLRICVPTVFESMAGRVKIPVCNDRLAGWSSKVVARAGIKVSLRGQENLALAKGCVVMSNHLSHYDVPVLFTVLGSDLRMIAKEELFQIPIFGPAMRVSGFVGIDRKNLEQAKATMEIAKQGLLKGGNVWIAPEGTRGSGERMGDFKKGGFMLSLQAQAPILPISLIGTQDVLPKNSLKTVLGQSVSVQIHPPIHPPIVDWSNKESVNQARDQLMVRVREAIASGLSSS
jgi:1-acyl-sn-glycerol-3-phosphate acyltransferase